MLVNWQRATSEVRTVRGMQYRGDDLPTEYRQLQV
jgi:hypothetical protein